jgi:hypothetical protein
MAALNVPLNTGKKFKAARKKGHFISLLLSHFVLMEE